MTTMGLLHKHWVEFEVGRGWVGQKGVECGGIGWQLSQSDQKLLD